MPAVLLDDRTVVRVAGPDAEHLLQNIVTTDLDKLVEGEARPGALLTPQGKILFDFLVSRDGPEAFRLDVRKDVAGDLQRRLMLYRLRAKADISIDDQVLVSAAWQTDSSGSETDSTRLVDTRFVNKPVLRIYDISSPPPLTPPLKGEGGIDLEALRLESGNFSESPSPLRGGVRGGGADQWTALRIDEGVAESGSDYALGDAFPHDVLLDQLEGIGMRKGCYIGQEVVSRMHHRGTARRRVLIADGRGDLPATGTDITAGGKSLGALGSVQGRRALAIVRIDRVKDAIDAGTPIEAGGVALTLSIPDWATFTFPEKSEAEQA